MKKVIITTIIGLLLTGVGYAQTNGEQILQPTHIVGKRINNSGEVLSVLESDFTYYEDGKPHTFVIPDYNLSTNYKFDNDYFVWEKTLHDNGYPAIQEEIFYTYENGRIKKVVHGFNYVNPTLVWEYSYSDDGRLIRKDLKEDDELDFHKHYLYEYENGGHTKIENYCTSWPDEGWLQLKKTIYQYDDAYSLTTRHIENYNASGVLTSSTLDTYTYTPTGKQETQVRQTLTDGEWANTGIWLYVYDDRDRVVEQQEGTWDAENNEWDINRKIIFELSEADMTYTVSFLRKSGDEWVWGEFYEQTILFGSKLYNQQRTLRFFHNEVNHGNSHINQFVMDLEYFDEPNYMGTEERNGLSIAVFPNPGNNRMTVQAPIENAVVRFYNLQGQLMIARPFDFSTEINTEGWPVGIYLWEIWNDNQKEAAGKWVKE